MGHLFPCTSCKVVYYCNQYHQARAWEGHKERCKSVKRVRRLVSVLEQKLRDSWPSQCEASVGRFWDCSTSRDYVRLRYWYCKVLLETDTIDAVELALSGYLELLRLDRSDEVRARRIVPHLLLRLGRDQACYDFVKWWTTKIHQRDCYDFGNTNLPYLDVRNADIREPVAAFVTREVDLGYVVAVTLVKMRAMLAESPDGLDSRDARALAARAQVVRLIRAVHDHNHHFWPMLFGPRSGWDSRNPDIFVLGPGWLGLIHASKAWAESPRAIETAKHLAKELGLVIPD